MTTYTWYGTPFHDVFWPSGNWESPADWAPPGGSGTVPGAGAAVVLNLAHTGGINYGVDTSSAITVASLTVEAGTGLVLTTADPFTVTNPSGLIIAGGGSVQMEVAGASLGISGQLRNAGQVDGGTIQLNGAVNLVNGGLINSSQFTNGGGASLTNSNETLDDSVIGDGSFAFTNAAAGQINGGLYASIDTGSYSFKNAGAINLLRDYLTIDSDVLNNSGTITDDGDNGGGSLLVFSDSSTRLEGGGTLTLVGGQAIVTGEGGVLTNVNNTISGDGLIGNYQGTYNSFDLAFTNAKAGTVDAGGSDTLTIDTGSNALTNAGLMEATGSGNLLLLGDTSVRNSSTMEALDSGTLTIENSTVTNSSSAIVGALAAGATLYLDDAVISGGLVESVAGSFITVGGYTSTVDALMHAMQNAGAIIITHDRALTLGGQLDNSGSISVTSASDAGFLVIDAHNLALSGGGSLTLANNGIVTGNDGSGKDTLTNIDNTISGDGTIGNNTAADQLNFVNGPGGTVDAGGSDSMTINTGSNALKNEGLMEATGSGQLLITGTTDIANSGTLEALDSAGVTVSYSGLTNTGTLEASGGGTFTDEDALVNRGNLLVQSGSKFVEQGAVTGVGTATINDGGTLEFEASVGSGQSIAFGANAQATMVLDDSMDFHGTVAGMTTSGKAAIDLTDIAYGVNTKVQYKANSAGTGGTVTISNGAEVAHIAVTGSYVAANFTIQNDGSGGTLLKDPPALLPSATSDLSQTGLGFACVQPDSLATGGLPTTFGKTMLDHLAMM